MKCSPFFKIVLIALACLIVAPIVSAAPVEVKCPTVISNPGTYILVQDINSSTGTPIKIQCSNVVFDGNGHTISGVDAGNSFGILVSGNNGPLSGVTVKNVRLNDFYDGLYFRGVNGGRIDSITATSNVRAGISLRSSSDNIISRCTVTQNGEGFYIWSECSRNRVESCTMKDNNEMGLWLASTGRTSNGIVYDSTNNMIVGNTATGNGRMGLYVDFSDGNTLSNNQVSSNEQFGIFLDYSSRTRIESNTVSGGSEQAVYLYDADSTQLIGNTVSGAADYGIWISSSSGNTIRSNTITRNGKGGLVLNGEEGIPTNDNTVTSNTIRDNGRLGIYLCRSTGNTITNNLFSNPSNTGFGTSCGTNSWNAERQPGTSITGGSTLGGNYWGHPAGTGFSETNPDVNKDGICDRPYSFSGNSDLYPLAKAGGSGSPTVTVSPTATLTVPTTVATIPTIPLPPEVTPSRTTTVTTTVTPTLGEKGEALPALPGALSSPQDIDRDGRYEDVNGNGRVDFSDVVLLFNNLDAVSASYPASVFDFNLNKRIDYSDVTALYQSL